MTDVCTYRSANDWYWWIRSSKTEITLPWHVCGEGMSYVIPTSSILSHGNSAFNLACSKKVRWKCWPLRIETLLRPSFAMSQNHTTSTPWPLLRSFPCILIHCQTMWMFWTITHRGRVLTLWMLLWKPSTNSTTSMSEWTTNPWGSPNMDVHYPNLLHLSQTFAHFWHKAQYKLQQHWLKHLIILNLALPSIFSLPSFHHLSAVWRGQNRDMTHLLNLHSI